MVKYELNNLTPGGKLFQNWADIVGLELSEYLLPRYLREGILYLEIIKTMNDREFSSMKKKLKKMLAGIPGTDSIQDVKFI